MVYHNITVERHNRSIYETAKGYYDNEEYEEARDTFLQIVDYKDSSNMADICDEIISTGIYNDAMELRNSGKYMEAAELFQTIPYFKDAKSQSESCIAIKRSEYVQNIGLMVYKVNKYKELSMAMYDVIIGVWESVEDNGLDVTVELQKVYKEWESSVQQLKIGEDGLKKQIDPIEEQEDAKDAYIMLQKIYELYIKINDEVISPTGSLLDYKKKMIDYSKEFDSLLQKLFSMETGVKTEFNRQVGIARKIELESSGKVLGE